MPGVSRPGRLSGESPATGASDRFPPNWADNLKIIVIADDFTGAAEAAGIGFRFGRSAEVALQFAQDQPNFVSIDTDTRLCPPSEARAKLQALGAELARSSDRLVFKKVDSILRGNVFAETTALAEALGKTAVLLVPANPSMGRTIRNGRYYIDGRPIDDTDFRDDPHHPVRDSRIGQMLGCPEKVVIRRSAEIGPIRDFTVGEAASLDDLLHSARAVDDRILPAGGGEFLAAIMLSRGRTPAARMVPISRHFPTLWIAGSTAAACRRNWKLMRAAGKTTVAMPRGCYDKFGSPTSDLSRWQEQIQSRLLTVSLVVAAVAEEATLSNEATARRITEAFADLVEQLWSKRAFKHLVVEGGATAAAILRRLGWTRLSVAAEWSPGAVSLRPAGVEDMLVTVKPGSYVWPEPLLSFLDS